MTSPEIAAFVARLADLLRSERSTLVEFLLALAESDRDRRWQQLGYASLFDLLHRALRLAKGTAFYRKTAVQLVQQFPEVVEPLRDGRLRISSVAELAKVLTRENLAETLPRFFHCSRQEAKAVTAELRRGRAPCRRPPSLRRDPPTSLPTSGAPSGRATKASASGRPSPVRSAAP